MGQGNRRRTVLIGLLGVALIVGTILMFREPPEGAAPASAPRVGKAGRTTDVIPRAWRAQSKAAERELARAAPVFWQDIVWTERAARARLAIVDGSILNLGPETRLRVLPQDKTSSHTSLILQFGKIRAKVLKKSKEGRALRIQTPTAVMGVIGTEFYVDASPETTTVICLEGQVSVRNRRGEVAGEETLSAGEKTEVRKVEPPTPKRKATAAEMAQAVAVTTTADYVPSVTLPDRRGNRVDLRPRPGRALVINYWATWNPSGISLIPVLNSLYAEFRGQGVDFIGVSMDVGGWNAIDQFV
ncbi:MAG: FecR domain-containing protein, partial [Terriglobia bacterium]